MSNQDDLDSNYKAASNEQPSDKLDQLIIQAAADALKVAPTQNDAAESSDKSNVIKGRFRFSKWQTPVSIAAATLFTVSFISTYDLWQNNEQDFLKEDTVVDTMSKDEVVKPAPPVTLSQDAAYKKDQAVTADFTAKRRQKSLPMKKLSKEQTQLPRIASPQALSKPTYESDEKIAVTGSRLTRENEIRANQSAVEEEALNAFKLESIDKNTAGYIAKSEPEALSFSEEAEEIVKLKTDPQFLGIAKWLEKIESTVENDKVEIAKAEIVILLKQHLLSSFTKHQRDRFDKINEKIELAQNNK